MIIKENISLKPYTTFMTEATARYFCEIKNEADFYELLEHPLWTEQPRLILGAGSNMLVVEDFKGLVVHINTRGREVVKETDEIITIKVAAGELWHPLVMDMVKFGYWGIENLALIPGTVGAAPVQNIGAYGVEAKDTISSVDVINLHTQEKETLNNDQCEFAYRSSIFKHQPDTYLVMSVNFILFKKPQPHVEYGAIQQQLQEMGIDNPTSEDIANVVIRIRQSKLPDVGEIGMAGSFFKNPVVLKSHAERLKELYPEIVMFPAGEGEVKISAGWLIEYLGYKGIKEGKVGTYQKHALVLVNYGEATGEEVWNFAQKIINHVHQVFDITLEPEVLVIQNP